MGNKYKLILSNKWMYKEITLSDERTNIQIGTQRGSTIRFRKEYFHDDFVVMLDYSNGRWTMSCVNTSYITEDGVSKLAAIELGHGLEFYVNSSRSDEEIFRVSCVIDKGAQDFSKQILLKGISSITIGGNQDCDIYINDPLIKKYTISIVHKNNRFYVVNNQNIYGIYVNGIRIHGNKELANYDFIAFAGYEFYLKDGILCTSVKKQITVNGLDYRDDVPDNTCFEYPKFNRNTRIKYVIPNDKIEVLNPPNKPEKSKKSLLFKIIPAIISLVLIVVLRGILSSSGGMFVVYSAATMGVGVIVSIISAIDDKKKYEEELINREEKYMQYINDKEKDILANRDNELRIRRINQPNVKESIDEVFSFGKRLFEKDNNDEDFLSVYLGLGKVKALKEIEINQKEYIDNDDELSLLPEKLKKKYEYIYDAPIVAEVGKFSSIGIVGDYNALCDMITNFTMDMAIRHYYKEVKMYYLFPKEEGDKFSWIRWLRHVYNEDLKIKNLVIDEESSNTTLDYLYSKLSQRKNSNRNPNEKFDVHHVVMVFGVQSIKKHPISKFIEIGNKYGITFIFFETEEEMLPKGCASIIQVDSTRNKGYIWPCDDADDIVEFAYEPTKLKTAKRVSKRLAPVYIDEVGVEVDLKKKINMYELLNINNIEEIDLSANWTNSQVYKSMSVPLGVKRKDEVVYLDISDKPNAHGPHGLVAGTTGSGKSEILQSYMLSMAIKFNPYDVAFVIIDFKGGGMANQFKNFPHLLGTITNIDGREINRSLLSIKAELVKRQEIFSRSNVNHINDYIKLYKQGRVKIPMPHLIIIVDEFAELKAEYPDFMKEIISAARIGRTLGVHLILATQKPAGVVDNQIWSNSKFKLCLKVQTKEDSSEVLKNPLAAEIVEPGRAYLQVGNNEMFELFQSAYSGDKVIDNDAIVGRKYEINLLNIWGKKHLVYTNKNDDSGNEAATQLDTIVNYISNFCRHAGIRKLPGICLPPLEDKIERRRVRKIQKNILKGITVPIGIYDDPEQQRQDVYTMNLSESNTYVIGSAQTGKTTFMQTVLYELMDMYSPDEVNMYILDCGNMALKVFESANHVGGVVLVYEEERVKNLFKLIHGFIKERKAKLSSIGLGTYRAYLEAGYYDLPQIVMMIDNYDAFKDYYPDLLDEILVISREGQSVGINLVITATHTNTISYKALTNFANRIAYVCNDLIEYSNLFSKPRIQPKEVPGRAIALLDKKVIELQTMICVEGEKEITRVENIKAFIEANSVIHKNKYARLIPEVPEIIRKSQLLQKMPRIFSEQYKVPVGISFDKVEYEFLDLKGLGLFAVTGREKSGKTNFVINILDTLAVTNSFTQAFIIDSDDGHLKQIANHPVVAKYVDDAKSLDKIIEVTEKELESRKELAKVNGIEAVLSKKALIMLVIENENAFTLLKNDINLFNKLKNMIKQYKDYKFVVVCSNVENANISFSATPLMKEIKDYNNYMIFEDIADIKIIATTMKQQREEKKPLKLGDGFLAIGGKLERIRTILND
ncbi:MAG: type VII secretion protein EssC [Lachnospiraceae bacterium]|nr:type VII secretion protein EssC [Lachnospiraceae bacterium]